VTSHAIVSIPAKYSSPQTVFDAAWQFTLSYAALGILASIYGCEFENGVALAAYEMRETKEPGVMAAIGELASVGLIVITDTGRPL
jgi:hypothetical protein